MRAVDEREKMLARLMEDRQQTQSAEDVLRQARISHGSTMSFHISSSYNSQPKPSLVRLQYGGAGPDVEEYEEVDHGAGETQSLTPAHRPKAIVIKPTPRFGSVTFGGPGSPAGILTGGGAGDGTSAPGLRPVSGVVRTAGPGSASGSRPGSGKAAAAADSAEPQEVASNKWTVAPFPTRFLWGALPAAEEPAGGAADLGAVAAGPAGAAGAHAASATAAVQRGDTALQASHRSRMRRMSATEFSPQPPLLPHRSRTPGVMFSNDGAAGGAAAAAATASGARASLSSGQVVMPTLSTTLSGVVPTGDAPAGGSNASPPLPGPAAAAAATAARAEGSRGGRFASLTQQTSGDAAAPAAGDHSKPSRHSVSGVKDPSHIIKAAMRDRGPSLTVVRSSRDPGAHRSLARSSVTGGADPGSDTEPLGVARSGVSTSVARSGASFTGVQQQRLRGSTTEAGTSAGGGGGAAALRPTPLSIPTPSPFVTPHSGQRSPPGLAPPPPTTSLAAAAGIQPAPSAGGSPVRMPSCSHSMISAGGVAGFGSSGAPLDSSALSLLSRVTRVQPRQPPPQEWKTDTSTLEPEVASAIDALCAATAAGGGGSGCAFGAHGYMPARAQPGGSWGSRTGTADGGSGLAVRPASPRPDGTSESGQLAGNRNTPLNSLLLEECEGLQRTASGERPGAITASGESPSSGGATRGGPLPRQLPALVAARPTTPPPAHATPAGVTVRSSARGSNSRCVVIAPDERTSAALQQSANPPTALRTSASPVRAPRASTVTIVAPNSPTPQPAVGSPPLKQPGTGTTSHAHPVSARQRATGSSQGSGGVTSAASSFTAGQHETVELRRARLIALGAMERPASPTGGPGTTSGGAGSEGGGVAAQAGAAAAAGAGAPGRLPGLSAKVEPRQSSSKADLRGLVPNEGAGGGGAAGSEEHESIMMRMKKALSFLRRGD